MLPEQCNIPFTGGEAEIIEWEPTEDEIACAVELNKLATFRSQFKLLRTKFRSFRSILDTPPESLDVFPSNSLSMKDRFVEHRSTVRVGTEMKKIPSGVEIITWFDRRYPAQLRDIYNPPPVLYVRGNIGFDYSTSLAIVGSRAHTDYGRQTAEMFAFQLASWGFMIVSGGARGIDSIAHRSALKASGRTIAVFGSGIDFIFPAENKKLFENIVESGALISEFPIGTIPDKFNFPVRNRIIAGLARGTLVVEAPMKSGALITAELALQGGREVFAVPGRLTDMRSKGANLLIRDGAQPALDPTDIPLRFGLIVVPSDSPDGGKAGAQLEGDEKLVFAAVGLEAKGVDDLVREVGLPAPRILSTLLILQTRGLIRELPGSRFVRPVGTRTSTLETEKPPDDPQK